MSEIIASQVGCYALELTLAYLQIFALKSTLNLKKKIASTSERSGLKFYCRHMSMALKTGLTTHWRKCPFYISFDSLLTNKITGINVTF